MLSEIPVPCRITHATAVQEEDLLLGVVRDQTRMVEPEVLYERLHVGVIRKGELIRALIEGSNQGMKPLGSPRRVVRDPDRLDAERDDLNSLVLDLHRNARRYEAHFRGISGIDIAMPLRLGPRVWFINTEHDETGANGSR